MPRSKHLTNGAKISAVIVALIGLVAKALFPDIKLPYDDVLKAAGFIVIVFSPIDVSLWLEKVFQQKENQS